MRKLISLSVVVFAAVGLIACGDDITNITETIGMQMVEVGEKVPDCTDKNKGDLVYVLDSAAAFFCADGEWQSWKGEKGDKGDKGSKGDPGSNGTNGTNGENGKSCTTKQVKDGIQVTCPGSDPLIIKNGTNGTNGINGTNGKNGKSCTAKEVEDGVEVSCPGSDPVVIKNGTAGASGKSAYELSGTDKTLEEWLASLKGENGKSCTTKQVEDGVEVNCPGSDPVVIKNGTAGASGKSAYELSGTDKTMEEWLASLKGEAGKSCTTKQVEDGVEVSCPGSDLVVVKNGTNGTNGANGKSCTVEKSEDFDGYNVKCYNDAEGKYEVVGQLTNGTNGADGRNFEEGWMVDHRDYHIYKIVTIGTQTWMAENLNYATANSYCSYDNDRNCANYGRLYTWAAAVGMSEDECGYQHKCGFGKLLIQGVCPDGWHLPSKDEFETLIAAVDGGVEGEHYAGKALKSASGWNNDGNGDDTYSFTALPAGTRAGNGSGAYGNMGKYASFWSSTELNSEDAYFMYLHDVYDNAFLSNYRKFDGFSVRCLKDSE